MCSETRASRLFRVLTAATLPQTPLLVIPLNYISEPCPSVPLRLFPPWSETAQRPHYSYASKSVPLTVFLTIWTASRFCQLDRNGLPPLCQFRGIISSIYIVSKTNKPKKQNKQTKKPNQPKRDSCSFIIQNSISCLPGACLLQKETIRNGGFPLLQNSFQTPMVWF